MTYAGRILICLVGGAALSARAGTDGSVTIAQPYAPIVTRNVFNLSPLDVPEPPKAPLPPQPPTVFADGITTVFGRAEVLFKVVVLENSPEKQTQTASYILSEGEIQDGVEVLHIDAIKRVITFNNHGTIQELPVGKVTASAGAGKLPPAPVQVFFNPSNRAE
jgi:hypothetical protein